MRARRRERHRQANLARRGLAQLCQPIAIDFPVLPVCSGTTRQCGKAEQGRKVLPLPAPGSMGHDASSAAKLGFGRLPFSHRTRTEKCRERITHSPLIPHPVCLSASVCWLAHFALKDRIMAILRKAGGHQAGRWRGLVQRTVVVAVVLALLQSLLYRTYYHGEQQQQAGGVALSIPATNLGSSGKAAHAEGAAQAAADLDDKPPSASAADAQETGAVAAAAATVQDAEASAAQEAATAAAAAQLAEGTAGVAQQPAPGATQDQAAADAAAAALGTRAGGRMACEGSGMCSVGKVKQYWGEVTTNKQLRTMLEGLAYKKDVILVTSGVADLPSAINIVENAKYLGLANIFLLMWDESFCDQVPAAYKPLISCVWDARRSEESASVFWDTMNKRWELAARALRMGYNVLSLDADTSLLDDPYHYLKHPLFARYNAIFHRDGVGYNDVNCGVMYWQNCHPAGPVAYMAVELADRTLRQREDTAAMKEMYKPNWHVADSTWEQAMWNDMLHGAAHGRPVIRTPGEPNFDKAWFKEQLDHSYGLRLKQQEVEWPPEWRKVTLYERGPLDFVEDLKFPAPPSPEWWAQHARHFYPPQRRNSSTAFRQLALEAGAPHPLFEVGQPWQPPADLPRESFAYMPAWFASTWVYRGTRGFWALQPPSQVVAHAAYSHTPGGSGVWKSYAAKGHGWWHWQVSEAFNGGSLLGAPGAPRLLMLAPGVALYTETEEAFKDKVEQLWRLARGLGRTLVAPNPPCDSPWLGVFSNAHDPHFGFQLDRPEDADIHVWPDVYDGMAVLEFPDLQQRQAGPQRNASYCHWIRCIHPDCLKVIHSHVDATAWMAQALTPQQAQPSQSNTLWHAEWEAAGGANGLGAHPQMGLLKEEKRVASVPAATVPTGAAAIEAGKAGGLGEAPVLFLGAVPTFADEAGLPPADELRSGCYLFAAGRELDYAPSTWQGRDNRQARLNGTAAAAAAGAAVAA
ncbi:hypothetical protein ABPG77_006019 [Micractinium sp. CCAP 211/92]